MKTTRTFRNCLLPRFERSPALAIRIFEQFTGISTQTGALARLTGAPARTRRH